ncbi:hypothetical protein [Nonomuraea sp. NPDC048916]|uniref:hypothetical protein n=1 Tax=Nonomuraea sp. NPDC048916 TaxID=3154232 RepID=UPI0033DC8BFA
MTPSRWRPLIRLAMVVVAAAVVASSAPTGPSTATGRPGVAVRPGPSPVAVVPHPGWRVVPAAEPICRAWPEGGPSIAHLAAVAATGPDDAWAVGLCESADWSCGPEGVGCDNENLDAPGVGIVQHWDGRRWTQVRVPDTEGFDSVVALSKDDVWIGGGDGPFHWDGRRWSRAVQGLKAGNVLLSGVTSSNVWGFDGSRLYHWEGRRWRQVKLPAGWHITSGSSAVTAGSGDDVWVLGMSTKVDEWVGDGRFRDARYDGGRWHFLPRPPKGYTVTRNAVVDGETWAVLTRPQPDATFIAPLVVLARWDGRRWARSSSPIRMWDRVQAVAGDGRGGLWLLTDAAEHQYVWHWDRSRWNVLELSHPLTARTATVHALAHVPGTTTVWGVGQFGANDSRDEQPFIETTGPLPH